MNALKAHELLGGGAFLPVHWGTFSLAMHDWDEPAETLLARARPRDLLLMPRLGEAVEPAAGRPVQPWWRQALRPGRRPAVIEPETAAQGERPARERDLPWPLD